MIPKSEHNYSKYSINFEQGTKESGTIWVNPSTNELSVNLSKIYEGKFSITPAGEDIVNPEQLTYTINNAEKDVTFAFKYTETDENIPNPFKVCKGNDCASDLKTYDFKKGENYKIHVVMQKIGNKITLPAFSFGDQANMKTSDNAINLRFNLWIISLLLLLL